MERVHRSSLCVMGISKQAEGASLPLLNAYIVGLMAAHFTTHLWPEYIYIYISYIFSRDTLSAVVRQRQP